jgi:uncharacterized membrane protein SirB2
MSVYLIVKNIHVYSVILSFALFLLRGGLMFGNSGLRQHVALRIGPHVIDTVLLASALTLSWLLQQYPFVHPWLTVKVLALVAYIVFGNLALKRARTMRLRAFFFLLAVLTFLFMASVALLHYPLGFLSWLPAVIAGLFSDHP